MAGSDNQTNRGDKVDHSARSNSADETGRNLFHAAYSAPPDRNGNGTEGGGSDGPSGGGRDDGGSSDGGRDDGGSGSSVTRPRHHHHRHVEYPLPEVNPFVIIGANPGEVRTNNNGKFDEITPKTSTSANPGEVRPGVRVQ
jgi:hypothetical protein